MDSNFFQNFIENIKTKQKTVLYVFGIIAALIGGIYYLTQIYFPEQEKLAQESIFMAQLNFENKNFEKALNGDGKFKGFNYVKDNFSFTKAKEIAQLYAGICNLNLGKFDKAIDDLKGYSSDVPEIQALAYSALGDAYAEKNNMNEAISYYDKAAKESQNGVLAPRLALKAGKAYEVKKDFAKAIEMYKSIKKDFPNSQEAQISDIYLAKVENQM